jgi:hypothetical protein
MTKRRNVRLCNGPQNHQQGPKVSFEKVQDQNHACHSVDKQGVSLEEFVHVGQWLRSVFYVEVMRKLLKCISRGGGGTISSIGQLFLVARQ